MLSSATEYVLYFDGSVSGLQIGSPVVFRGVPLGSVTRIALEARPGEAGPTIPVYVQLRDGAIEWAGGTPNAELQRETFRRMIQGGLRARLQMQSLVTGQFRIELDFAPGTEAVYRSSTPDLEIPTLPSPIDQLQKRLARLPLADMVASADVILRSLATTLGSGKLDTTLETVTGAFAGMQATFARLFPAYSAGEYQKFRDVARVVTAKEITIAARPGDEDIVTCLDGECRRSRQVRLRLSEKKVNFFGPAGCDPNATVKAPLASAAREAAPLS